MAGAVGGDVVLADGAERVDGKASFAADDREGPVRLAGDLLARATPGIAGHFTRAR